MQKIAKIPHKRPIIVKKIGSLMVIKYDFFELRPKSEMSWKMFFLSRKKLDNKKVKNNKIILIIVIQILKIIIAIFEIFLFVCVILSISKRVLIHKSVYFFSISAFFSRFFTSVMILYGVPRECQIFCNSARTSDSGKIKPMPGKSLFIVVIVPVNGFEICVDDSKIFDFPKVKSIFCPIKNSSFIGRKWALLPANCALYTSSIRRDIPMGILAPERAESVTENTGISLSSPNEKNQNFALTGIVTSRKIFVFSKFSS